MTHDCVEWQGFEVASTQPCQCELSVAFFVQREECRCPLLQSASPKRLDIAVQCYLARADVCLPSKDDVVMTVQRCRPGLAYALDLLRDHADERENCRCYQKTCARSDIFARAARTHRRNKTNTCSTNSTDGKGNADQQIPPKIYDPGSADMNSTTVCVA